MAPKISVCIPAYNRPDTLYDLLQSVVSQDYDDFEVVISEDHSPRAKEIEAVVNRFIEAYPGIKFRLFLNEENLGYDENFRSLLSRTTGSFCVYMGDDDLMLPGALQKIGEIIDKYDNLGIILRSWCIIDRETRETMELFRYFSMDRFFPSGNDSVIALFRRSVTISGFTVHRKSALKFSTDQFDGTLLYQLYLTLRILMERDGFYVSDVYFAVRKARTLVDQKHYFGSSKKEEGLFAPGVFSPQHSLNFMKGMLAIAKAAKSIKGVKGAELFKRIIRDIDNYSYPFMAMHRSRIGAKLFIKYVFDLVHIGFGRTFYFWTYFFMLLLLGESVSNRLINKIKWALGRTPALGGLYSGIEP